MKHFRCGDLIPGCGAVFTGTQGEILEQVRAHAQRTHGTVDLPDSLVRQVLSAMTPA